MEQMDKQVGQVARAEPTELEVVGGQTEVEGEQTEAEEQTRQLLEALVGTTYLAVAEAAVESVQFLHQHFWEEVMVFLQVVTFRDRTVVSEAVEGRELEVAEEGVAAAEEDILEEEGVVDPVEFQGAEEGVGQTRVVQSRVTIIRTVQIVVTDTLLLLKISNTLR
jgi:hypothetical protein